MMIFFRHNSIAEFTLQFLTCYFFGMMLFFDPISVSPLFVQDGVKKIMTSLFFCIVFLVENRYLLGTV